MDTEREFACDALPCPLVGELERNSDLMSRYIKFIADRLLGALGMVRFTMHRPI